MLLKASNSLRSWVVILSTPSARAARGSLYKWSGERQGGSGLSVAGSRFATAPGGCSAGAAGVAQAGSGPCCAGHHQAMPGRAQPRGAFRIPDACGHILSSGCRLAPTPTTPTDATRVRAAVRSTCAGLSAAIKGLVHHLPGGSHTAPYGHLADHSSGADPDLISRNPVENQAKPVNFYNSFATELFRTGFAL